MPTRKPAKRWPRTLMHVLFTSLPCPRSPKGKHCLPSRFNVETGEDVMTRIEVAFSSESTNSRGGYMSSHIRNILKLVLM